MSAKPILIVQGGQYGSEAKGAIAGWLALERNVDFAVRTGSINAGHTVYYKGKPYVNQQLPVGWVNPNTKLVLGPGAYVHFPTLMREISMIQGATGVDPSNRIYIDPKAGVHLDSYADESKEVNRHHLIGATGKGCAEAIVHKILDRGKLDLLVGRPALGIHYVDVPMMLTRAYEDGAKIMLEGTQGELLDFHLGPWPYVTARQTTPAAWVAEAGLSPALNYEIVLVMRTYPIRVAGNSGPLPGEITWPMLARWIRGRIGEGHPLYVSEEALQAFETEVARIGDARGIDLLNHHKWTDEYRVRYKDILSEYSTVAIARMSPPHQAELRKLFEFTTVTRKLRRIARFYRSFAISTVYRIKPSWVILTFVNYVYPELHGATVLPGGFHYDFGVPIGAVTTGPGPEHVICL